MTVNRRDIVAGIEGVLSTIDGTGDYVHDLTPSGAVSRLVSAGQPATGVLPRVEYALGARQDNRAGEGADLSFYGQSLTVDLIGYVARSGTGADTLDAAGDLEADMVRAFHGSRKLTNGSVHDLSLSTDVVVGPEAAGTQRLGVVVMTLTLLWRRR